MRPGSALLGQSLGIQTLAGWRDLAWRLEYLCAGGHAAANKEKSIMNPIAAGVAGALMSGMAMYTMGARTAQVDAFTPTAAPVQTVGAQFVPVANYSTALRPVAAPAIAPAIGTARPSVSTRRAPLPQRTVDRSVTREDREPVREEEVQPDRSWGKTAMIIGGSAAGAAGVGGIVGGKKGAMVGAAIGGGAASIYEATRRR